MQKGGDVKQGSRGLVVNQYNLYLLSLKWKVEFLSSNSITTLSKFCREKIKDFL
jgi:hypothetical protein